MSNFKLLDEMRAKTEQDQEPKPVTAASPEPSKPEGVAFLSARVTLNTKDNYDQLLFELRRSGLRGVDKSEAMTATVEFLQDPEIKAQWTNFIRERRRRQLEADRNT